MSANVDKTKLDELINCLNSETAQKYLKANLKLESCNHASCPKKFTEDVHPNNKGETAYQRAIFSGKNTRSSLENTGDVTWLDIEIPVVFGKASRRSSLDLIGRANQNNKLVLCELKYANPKTSYKSNNPTYALLELLIYYYHIQKNMCALAEQEIRHTNPCVGEWNWNDCAKPENIILAVVANKEYWDRWNNKNWPSNIATPIETIMGQLSFLDIKFFETASIPKGRKEKSNGRYEPAPLDSKWIIPERMK